VELEVFLHRPR